MKVYFTASVSGSKKYLNHYKKIVETLEKLDCKVLEQTTKVNEDYVYNEISDDDKVGYYKQVLKWMNQADVVLVEASSNSLSLGHEITVALEKGKPVIVLHSTGKASHFLVGVKSDKLIVEKYSLEDLEDVLEFAIKEAAGKTDTRFNFFISPKIANYLDWIARKKRVPRAVYLRRLIEEDMGDSNFSDH
ncbi:hypothetical protein ACFL1M_00410 [Patescibacteria group bacterium]